MIARMRPWRAQDAHVVLEAAADPDIALQLPPIASLEDAEAYILRPSDDEHGYRFAITIDDVAVGNVSASVNVQMRTAWMSYWLLAEARGQGLTSRGLVTLCTWLLDERGLYRLELAHRLDSMPSQRVAERAGFIREGILRQEVEYDGVRYDTALMSRLVTDPRPDVTPLPGLLSTS